MHDTAQQAWLRRVDDIVDDTLGTLIAGFLEAAPPGPAKAALAQELPALRLGRNMLCHASWRPGTRDNMWHPTCINTRGEGFVPTI
nr:hypothetical protein [Paracoccus saliphilus]